MAQSERLFISRKQRQENDMTGLVRITVPSWRINDSVLSQLLTALVPYPDLIIDWRDDMSKLDAITHRVDIGLHIGLKPDENFIVKKNRRYWRCISRFTGAHSTTRQTHFIR